MNPGGGAREKVQTHFIFWKGADGFTAIGPDKPRGRFKSSLAGDLYIRIELLSSKPIETFCSSFRVGTGAEIDL